MSEPIVTAPCEVTLAYRLVGKTHVFTAGAAAGLHIGSSDLRIAFECAIEGLSKHFTRLYGRNVSYKADIDFAEFQKELESPGDSLAGGFVLACLSQPGVGMAA